MPTPACVVFVLDDLSRLPQSAYLLDRFPDALLSVATTCTPYRLDTFGLLLVGSTNTPACPPAVLLAVLAMIVAALANLHVVAVIAIYLASQFAYSISLKHIPFVDVLLAAPWQVSVVVGVVVFIGLKWILPALAGSNMFLKPISAASSSVAWLFGGFFLLMGAAVFAKSKIAKERLSAATPTIQGVSPRP